MCFSENEIEQFSLIEKGRFNDSNNLFINMHTVLDHRDILSNFDFWLKTMQQQCGDKNLIDFFSNIETTFYIDGCIINDQMLRIFRNFQKTFIFLIANIPVLRTYKIGVNLMYEMFQDLYDSSLKKNNAWGVNIFKQLIIDFSDGLKANKYISTLVTNFNFKYNIKPVISNAEKFNFEVPRRVKYISCRLDNVDYDLFYKIYIDTTINKVASDCCLDHQEIIIDYFNSMILYLLTVDHRYLLSDHYVNHNCS